MSIPICDAVEHSPAATNEILPSTSDAASHANAQEPWRAFE